MQAIEEASRRWVDAGLIDAETAGRICAFEQENQRNAGTRWPALIAWIFGAILLASGICLFVAAHWDKLSPGIRFATVVAMVALLHGAAMAVRERHAPLATALHGVGTIAAGAAIFLTGQIFNLQEHWPGAILLWALCAAAGWWLLRDQVQELLTWLLFPAWLICEWSFRAEGFRDNQVMLFRMVLTLAAFFLTAFLHSRKKVMGGLLFAVSTVAGTIAIGVLSEGPVWQSYLNEPMSPWELRIGGWLLIALLPLALAFWQHRATSMYVAAAVLTAIALPHLHHGELGAGFAAFAWVATLAAFTTWWGIREASQRLLNFGVVAFGLTVLWYYTSNVMDKMERSLSLIGLGILFVAGGMALEKMRRRLVRQIVPREAA